MQEYTVEQVKKAVAKLMAPEHNLGEQGDQDLYKLSKKDRRSIRDLDILMNVISDGTAVRLHKDHPIIQFIEG